MLEDLDGQGSPSAWRANGLEADDRELHTGIGSPDGIDIPFYREKGAALVEARRLLVNTICFPFGDHCGSRSSYGPASVSCVRLVPSASIAQIVGGSNCGERVKITRFPFGETSGSRLPSSVSSVNARSSLPSGLMMKMFGAPSRKL